MGGLGPLRPGAALPAGMAEAESLQENREAPNSQPYSNTSTYGALCHLSSPPLLNFKVRFEAQHSRLEEEDWS